MNYVKGEPGRAAERNLYPAEPFEKVVL